MNALDLTFCQGNQGDELGEHALGDGGAGDEAGVVARVGAVHLGDVQVARRLGDKAPLVQRDEEGELVQHPPERQLGFGRKQTDKRLSIGGGGGWVYH